MDPKKYRRKKEKKIMVIIKLTPIFKQKIRRKIGSYCILSFLDFIRESSVFYNEDNPKYVVN
jgi:hypothetical protein